MARRWLAGGLAALLLLTGCGPASGKRAGAGSDALDSVSVSGDYFESPTVSFPTPLDVAKAEARVEIAGDGATLSEDYPLLLRYRVYDAITGDVLVDTYDRPPVVLRYSPGELDPATFEALAGAHYGERLTAVAPSADGTSNPAVFVIDVLALEANGSLAEPAPGMPPVAVADDGTPSVESGGATNPAKLMSETLITGLGPQVQDGDTITVQLHAQRWDDASTTQDTWDDRQPLTAKLSDVVEAWRDALPGVPVGSRVLLMSPPELASGDGAMIYIIDVLARTPDPSVGASPSLTAGPAATGTG